MSAERLDNDKDADENVDAEMLERERPVWNEQSIDVFTWREEIDIDFKVSGLPHAVCETSRKLSFSPTREEDRDTLFDKRFKPICNTVMPTAHLVKNQRRWFVTWAM